MDSLAKGELYIKKFSKSDQQDYLKTRFDLYQEISNQKMNNVCFDCRKAGPKYISINNAIFLCEECAQIHRTFPQNISLIIDNKLNLLSNIFLKYLYYGGNDNLDDFVNYEYPGLQNYTSEILYKTQAMIYYREDLKCKIEGKPKPSCPNNIMAYKLVSKNGFINIREENLYKTKKNKESKDVINNYYNNYNNTYNTFNSYNYINEDNFKNNNNSYSFGNNKNTKYCNLVNKTFFDEMNNLFSKKSPKKYIYNNKLTVLKSYALTSKMKNKYDNYYSLTNENNKTFNQSLPTINESFYNSLTNRANESIQANKILSKSIYFEHKSSNHHSFSQKYIKPKISKNKYKRKNIILNEFLKDKNEMKKNKGNIDISEKENYKDQNNLLNLNNKIYKQKIKIFNSFKIYKKPQNSDFDLSFEINKKKSPKKIYLLNKVDKKRQKYLFADYIHKIKNKNSKINLTKKSINLNKIDNKNIFEFINSNSNLNTIDSKYNTITNINKNKRIIKVKKNNYLNTSCDMVESKPIKVNLNITSKSHISPGNSKKDIERKRKALQDKKEQEKLEEEDLHNLLFERKDNDLFNNIIYMNNNK